MKIKLLRAAYGYEAGDIVTVPFHIGQLLLKKELAEKVEGESEPKKEPKKQPKKGKK